MQGVWGGAVEEVGGASSEQAHTDHMQGPISLLLAVVNQALVPFIWETEVHFSTENRTLK